MRRLSARQIGAKRSLIDEISESLTARDGRCDHRVWRTIFIRACWETGREKRRKGVVALLSIASENTKLRLKRNIAEAVAYQADDVVKVQNLVSITK